MTPQERKQFFALYWGQKVLYNDRLAGKNEELVYYFTLSKKYFDHDDYLLLKPISSITYQDLILLGFDKYYEVVWCDENGYLGSLYTKSKEWDSNQVDIIRSLGYAIGWKNYNVEDLIKEGLIKLQE